MNRNELLENITNHYILNRKNQVDPDYLEYEEENITLDDLKKINQLLIDNVHDFQNGHNSIILYLTGISNQFDLKKGRCDTVGGSPPDIDLDYEAMNRDHLVEMIREKWGTDKVANIITHGTFGPKSLTRRYFSINETPENKNKNFILQSEILKKIPDALFGKEPSLKEIIEGNKDKSYSPHPELKEGKYQDWYKFTSKLEDMVSNFGIHAAGVVLSNFPIYEVIPLWSSSKAPVITQYDMKEVEELGLIKYDFLSINNLDILKKCIELIKTRYGKEYNIYNIQDHDKKAYDLLNQGYVAGVFQMETSRTALKLIKGILPQSIEDLSDINALNRPGPLQYADTYISNKNNGYTEEDLPEAIKNITKKTHYILLYQEDVMKICTDIAGYTLREADDIRRALGKKKIEVLKPYRESFIKGCVKFGIDEDWASRYWDDTLIPFADYSFNRSHAINYSYLTYLCAYFKAHYPKEFYCALMSVRSMVMQPATWKEKAPSYILEARKLGVEIEAPCIQSSEIGFTIQDDRIHFGFNAIAHVGLTAAKAIIKARGKKKFIDIWDFLVRVDQRVINSRTLESLIYAGCFDNMGYQRQDLLDNLTSLVEYWPKYKEWIEHTAKVQERNEQLIVYEEFDNKIQSLIKDAKAQLKIAKKNKLDVSKVLEEQANLEKIFRQLKLQEISENALTLDTILLWQEKQNFPKKPIALKATPQPLKPDIKQREEIFVSLEEIIKQAEYIGCYVGDHPARILYSSSQPLDQVEEGENTSVAGQITEIKEIKTRKGEFMAIGKMNDGTESTGLLFFPKIYSQLKTKNIKIEVDDFIFVNGNVKSIEPATDIIVNNLISKRNFHASS